MRSRGGIAGGASTNKSYISNCVSLSSNITNAPTDSDYVGRIVGHLYDSPTLSGNYGNSALSFTPAGTANNKNGANAAGTTQANWQTMLGKTVHTNKGDATEANPWVWNSSINRPVLWFELP